MTGSNDFVSLLWSNEIGRVLDVRTVPRSRHNPPEFCEDVERVVQMATAERCALMCAEAVPWRCHRSLVGDALLVRGVRVEDIVGPGNRRPHVLTRFAQEDGIRITYPEVA